MENIFKVGDRVFHYAYKWGTVTNDYKLNNNNDIYIEVNFDHSGKNYFQNFKDGFLLSFTEYRLEGFTQERPEELPKKGQVVWTRGEFPSEWEIGHFFEKNGNEYRTYMSPSLKGWNNKGIEIRTTNPYEDEQY